MIPQSAAFLCLVLLLCPSLPAQLLSPPPVPEIPPVINEFYSCDQDGDRIDDVLLEQFELFSGTGTRVSVELIFKEQITQQQIDDFLALDGEITYIYQAVSYGWNGQIPLSRLEVLADAMGEALVLVQEPKEVVVCVDVATQTGRVRPVWQNDFAGNPLGFDGDPNTTIAVLDTGVDANHLDLTGRCVYWRDFTFPANRRASVPTDPHGHGSHVAGIAVGTGQSADGQEGIFRHTSTGNLMGAKPDEFLLVPMSLARGSTHIEATAIWEGNSTAQLRLLHSRAGWSQWYEDAAALGPSPLSLSYDFAPWSNTVYCLGLFREVGIIRDYVITGSVTNSQAVDEFSRFRGVAPGCSWGGARVLKVDGTGLTTWAQASIDDLVAKRREHRVKILNLSLGMTKMQTSNPYRQKVNSAVGNGIVVVAAAGNSGLEALRAKREIADPARAALAITVGASNDENALIDRSSHGFARPKSLKGREEDYKPDLVAPGGSTYYSMIVSADSGTNDTAEFPDQEPDDYCSCCGTSMASSFTAGCAALVIDAMEQRGIVWDFQSDQHPRYVKMVLCATATETNADREDSEFKKANEPKYDPTLERDEPGPSDFPVGKDMYEGYGIINPDAAVEAVFLRHDWGSLDRDTLGSEPTDRRAWARRVVLSEGVQYQVELLNPGGGDFDLYLYSGTPGPTGCPCILASSTGPGRGIDESISYTCLEPDDQAILVVKRIAGAGEFQLTSSH